MYMWIGEYASSGYTTSNKYVSSYGGFTGDYIPLVAGEYYPIRILWGHPITPTAVGLTISAHTSAMDLDINGFIGGFFHTPDQFELSELEIVYNKHGGRANFLRMRLLGYF